MHPANAPSWTVFGFPYAGGNAFVYRPLERLLPQGFRLHGVELPGRGRRAGEPLQTSLDALAADLSAGLARERRGPAVFFGHSMGALLAYRVALAWHEQGLPGPELLVVSGRQSPTIAETDQNYLLDKAAFREVLRDLGGCPPEILQEEELLDYYEPILRADFQVVETAPPVSAPPLDVPIIVLRGTEEDLTDDEAQAWAQLTTRFGGVQVFPGDHFFIQRHWGALAAVIAEAAQAVGGKTP